MNGGLPLSRLRRLLDERTDVDRDPCQRCGATLSEEHQHVADVATRQLLCVCPSCYDSSLSANDEAATQRAVPRRYLRMSPTLIGDAQWDAFQIPVGIAFVFQNTTLRRTVVAYPSPAGAVESLLPPDAWEGVLGGSGCAIAPDVEALLVRRTTDRCECFVVPIDACYELAGRVRRRWSGFGGGPEAEAEIDAFFAHLRAVSELVTA